MCTIKKIGEIVNRQSGSATRFVVMVGVMSLFADFTYEASRSVVGPYLGLLGLGAAAISVVTGLGELLGYGLRLFSGNLADSSKKFWPITILGYVVQMVAVPLLALAGSWQIAAWLIVQERMGKAIRNPPRDVMLSQAARKIGYGWAFGLHEALDQSGAVLGPLAMVAILAAGYSYRTAFAELAIPATIMLTILMLTWRTYPHPEAMDSSPSNLRARGLTRVYWVYMAGAVLAGFGIGGFPLISYHLQIHRIVPADLIPAFYAVAMGVGGAGSLVFGRLFDKVGMSILVPLVIGSALSIPLVWIGGFGASLLGIALWGLGVGVQESIIPAAVATMVPRERRASAYGIFTAGYGVSLFVGSIIIGLLYEINLLMLVFYGIAVELAAIPAFLWVIRNRNMGS